MEPSFEPLAYVYSFAIGYLLGSLPTAYWLCLVVYRINIFEHGSRNMGATNVHRVLGTIPFALTLILDILKGMLSVILTPHLIKSHISAIPIQLQLIAGLAAVIGHTLSFWVGFKGGKGVATALGVFLGLAPKSSIIAMAVFLVVLLITKFVSLGSIAGAIILPISIYYFQEGGPNWYSAFTLFACLIAAYVIYKHKANIHRLLRGEELALGSNSTSNSK